MSKNAKLLPGSFRCATSAVEKCPTSIEAPLKLHYKFYQATYNGFLDITCQAMMAIMKYKSFSNMNCSIAQTLEVLGERWTLLIIRDAFRGVSRFEDFLLTGMSRNVLTERLKRLLEYEIFEKRALDGKSSEYLLTNKGVQLQPILLSITHWGDTHMGNPNGIRTIFTEKKTGKTIAPMSAYSIDGRALSPSDVGLKPGPGSLGTS